MLSKKQISDKIGGIKTSLTNTRANIQLVLVSIAAHVFDNGNNSQYAELITVSGGVSQRALNAWIKEYGLATVKGKGSDKKIRTNTKARVAAAEEFADAEAYFQHLTDNAQNWYELIDSEKKVKPLNVATALEQLAGRVAAGAVPVQFTVASVKAAMAELELAMNQLCNPAVGGFAINVDGEDIATDNGSIQAPASCEAAIIAEQAKQAAAEAAEAAAATTH